MVLRDGEIDAGRYVEGGAVLDIRPGDAGQCRSTLADIAGIGRVLRSNRVPDFEGVGGGS